MDPDSFPRAKRILNSETHLPQGSQIKDCTLELAGCNEKIKNKKMTQCSESESLKETEKSPT